ncbi:MAG: hypothetical protein WCE75_08555 [Terracidiphilus sp.]
MVCPKCDSSSVSVVPAEIRLYRNSLRTLSHPPMTPSPDIRICHECGWSEFSIPRAWLAAGWLRQTGPKPTPITAVALTASLAHS